VDDDPTFCESMKMALEDWGFPVDCAANGQEALDRLRASSPAPGLVLLDVVMPVMDGLQFLAERKRDPALASIPVVVISAANRDHPRAIALGAAECLQKPLELEEVAATVDCYAN
jgi:CheY-like chemotaxis protein